VRNFFSQELLNNSFLRYYWRARKTKLRLYQKTKKRYPKSSSFKLRLKMWQISLKYQIDSQNPSICDNKRIVSELVSAEFLSRNASAGLRRGRSEVVRLPPLVEMHFADRLIVVRQPGHPSVVKVARKASRIDGYIGLLHKDRFIAVDEHAQSLHDLQT